MVYDPELGCVRGRPPEEYSRRCGEPYPTYHGTAGDAVIDEGGEIRFPPKKIEIIIGVPCFKPKKEPGHLKFTIGITRCGKSTYCDRWVRFQEDIPDEFPTNPRTIVCTDDIRLALHGQRFNRHAEPMVWALKTYDAKSKLIRGMDVIIDGTNTTKESILRIFNIDSNATYVLIDTDPEECKRRALSTGHTNLIEGGVIDRQVRQLAELKVEGIEKVVESIRERVKKRWREV